MPPMQPMSFPPKKSLKSAGATSLFEIAQQCDSYAEYCLRAEVCGLVPESEEMYEANRKGIIYVPYIPVCRISKEEEEKAKAFFAGVPKAKTEYGKLSAQPSFPMPSLPPGMPLPDLQAVVQKVTLTVSSDTIVSLKKGQCMDNKKKTFSKGKANQRSLADRMKTYEAVTTGTCLIEKLPIYARIDMRAGHSFCRGLEKPFDPTYADAMKKATAYVVEETGAAFGYCQSDEASFAWADDTKIPFGTRLFKLESVLASMFSVAFMKACLGTKLEKKLDKMLPTFDCRVCNMPTLDEVANMLLWRERDSIKNSITLLALEHYSTKQIDKKNSDDKIHMLKEEKGIDYYTAVSEECRCGAYFRRELYDKILTEEDLKKLPERNWPEVDASGNRSVIRSHIVQFFIGMPLNDVENKADVLFNGAAAVKKAI